MDNDNSIGILNVTVHHYLDMDSVTFAVRAPDLEVWIQEVKFSPGALAYAEVLDRSWHVVRERVLEYAKKTCPPLE